MIGIRPLVLLGLFGLAAGLQAAPLGSEFTFQGQLGDAGDTANGSYEFEFELFDDLNGGNSVSNVINRSLNVEDGYFNTLLDFGDLPFLGDQRWLQIRVRAAGDPSFQALTPRQTIAAAPYALHAQFVGAGAVGANEIDPSQVQQRVSSTCSAGTSIRQVNQDGSVICEVDNAGSSLWLEQGDGSLLSDVNVVVEPQVGSGAPISVRSSSAVGRPQLALVDTTTNNPARLILGNAEQLDSFWALSGSATDDNSQDRFSLFNSTTTEGARDLLTVRNNGHVGLGFNSDSPEAPLTVRSQDNWRPGTTGNGRGDLFIGNGDRGLSIGVAQGGGGAGTARIWTNNDKPILFVNTQETDILLGVDIEDGRVGIGTGSPATRLHVAGGPVRIDDLAHTGSTNAALAVEPDGDLVLANSGVQYLSLNSSAFFPADSSVSYESSATLRKISDSSTNALHAPIALPNGKRMREMTVHFRDESSTHDISISIGALALGMNATQIISSASTSGDTAGFRSITAPVGGGIATTINNAIFSYSVRVSASPSWPATNGFGIQAVVIRYE